MEKPIPNWSLKRMIHELTTEELIQIKEALELSLDEFAGIEECPAHEDYVLTTGADEACRYALRTLEDLLNPAGDEDIEDTAP